MKKLNKLKGLSILVSLPGSAYQNESYYEVYVRIYGKFVAGVYYHKTTKMGNFSCTYNIRKTTTKYIVVTLLC